MAFRILYIEDNLDDMRIVKRAIESRGSEFLWAQNGISGISMAVELQPDVILLDINLPDIGGYEVARRLRTSNNNPLLYVPIIAVTGNALRGDAEKALAAGCDVYMSKPINIRELWARIDVFLTGR